MARKWFKQASQRLRPVSKRRKSTGFTLIELLVAMFIGGIITSILLFLVVQLLQTSQRESARSDTQREMQMALDYIGRDLREAVYVYDGDCLTTSSYSYPSTGNKDTCPGLRNYLSPPPGKTKNLPVLAFWRVDPLPPGIDKLCKLNAGAFSGTPDEQKAALAPIKAVPCIAQRMYTLVVYSLDWDNPGSTWSGKARIKRYQLPQYEYGAATRDDAAPGWIFPGGEVSFITWPLNKAGGDDRRELPLKIPESPLDVSDGQVLVDFVDQQGLSAGSDNAANAVCPAVPTPPPVTLPSTAPVNLPYTLTPKLTSNRGFYVCVKGGENNGNLNQEVAVFLQGNAAGRPGLPLGASNVPISMQTRVMTRGAFEKRI